jgi:hypothetical protein
MQKLKRTTCPFVNLPEQDLQLRQPVFLGLRTDKEANDVVRE